MKLYSLPMLFASLVFASNISATEYEFTPYIGYTYSDNLDGDISGDNLSTSNDNSFGFSFAWQDDPNGQGMVFLNRVSHNYQSDLDNQTHSYDITYVHFNGVAMLRQGNYVTTVSLGAGGAYFDTDNSSKMFPSLTAAVGTRYEISDKLTFVTELRSYASLTNKANDLFCQNSVCSAKFSSAIWLETSISMGIAYKW